MDWIHLTQDAVHWLVLVNTAMKLIVSIKDDEFLC